MPLRGMKNEKLKIKNGLCSSTSLYILSQTRKTVPLRGMKNEK
jgi:hypothetical protein